MKEGHSQRGHFGSYDGDYSYNVSTQDSAMAPQVSTKSRTNRYRREKGRPGNFKRPVAWSKNRMIQEIEKLGARASFVNRVQSAFLAPRCFARLSNPLAFSLIYVRFMSSLPPIPLGPMMNDTSSASVSHKFFFQNY